MFKKLLFLLLVFCSADYFGENNSYAQTYTTTGNNTDWNNPASWVRTGDCGAINNGGPPPPRTLNAGNACPVKIIINHPINFAGNTTIGGGFMDSLIVNTGGNLTFSGNVTVNNVGNSVGPFSFTIRGGGILNVNGNFTNQNNGTSVRVLTGGRFNVGGDYITTGTSTSLQIDGSSAMAVAGTTTINSNHTLTVSGIFATNELSTGSGGTIIFNGSSTITVNSNLNHLNGTLSLGNSANLFVGGALSMNGSATLNLADNTDIKVAGNLNLSNGTINNAGSGDIRVDGNLSMSGGGRYNGSNTSYIQVNGDHNITSNNPVNLSGDSKFVALGDRTGGFWGGPTITNNGCYSSSNLPNSFCLPCSTGYTSSGTFYVPAGVTSITIEMVGGGGRGGNRSSSGRSGGGGGGAYSQITLNVTPGEPLAVVVGNGGNQGIGMANGSTSYVTRDPSLPVSTGSILFAGGGSAGVDGGSTVLAGGTGGVRDTRVGITSFSGANGASSTTGSSGGGGSAAGNNGSGNIGGNPAGGTDPAGIGGPGGDGNNSNNSNGFSPISGYGGGGGGGRRTGNSGLGGNGSPGYVLISYTCPTNTACSRFLDFGTNDGFTIIEYFCSGVWNAPEGLEEFSVTSIGGGGGGGFGNSAGGGGAGAILTQNFSNINQQPANPPSQPAPITYGLPANTNFTVSVGNGGSGAISTAQQGTDGFPSSVSGTFTNYANTSVSLSSTATGGGGGGTSSTNAIRRNGRQGGSGGGGASISGQSAGTGGGVSGTGNRNSGGAGRNGSNSTFQGGGGGGATSSGNQGSNNGNGQSRGGIGGDGILIGVPGVSSVFAGGGGGTATGASNNFAGSGGSGGGGNGNNSGTGGIGAVNTGSGGGAGSGGGGAGGSGRVYIYYENVRILPVEFLAFTATYQKENNSATLDWSTAKEWENSHFEVERAVNSVKEWETIGRTEGEGYSDGPVAYNFTDSDLPKSGGNVFYRLKQVDFSGTFSYSLTRAIQVNALESNQSWIAYPNPSAKGKEVRIELLKPEIYQDQQIYISLSNLLGQTKNYSPSSPEEISSIVSDWLNTSNSGLYILDIAWGDQRQQLKLLRN